MNETFGQLLKEIRRDKNVSQRELALSVGVDYSYISKIENDRLPPPAAETILKIAARLKVPHEILLANSGKVSNDLKEVISNPEAIRFLNEVKQMNLSDTEWQSLQQQLKSLR
jgi:transcriptional regulator with XRE-family HTH domain